MKKLMIGFAAAGLCAAVFADVTSANIVGYAGTGLPAEDEGLAVGPCFIPVTGDTIDLGDIKVVGYETECKNGMEVQTLDEYGDSDRSFTWKDYYSEALQKQYYGWYEDGSVQYSKLDDDEKILLVPGEGLFAVASEDDLKLQSSGQVPTAGDVETPLAAEDEGLLIVNPTPVAVDLGSCKVGGYDGECKNGMEVQTLDEYGDSDRSFTWKDYYSEALQKQYYGWYEDGSVQYSKLDDDEKVTVEPGQGLFSVSAMDDLTFIWPKVEVK